MHHARPHAPPLSRVSAPGTLDTSRNVSEAETVLAGKRGSGRACLPGEQEPGGGSGSFHMVFPERLSAREGGVVGPGSPRP